ncbi:hypothetical protein LO762_29885 [Actinocorallia sp. API 0066]|uniref:hypothetical protein n=1 Tax=Actinocorallia sp. API 0066 TaxID=2896846 RepID=UPI001E4C2296|nr:hypothetical protein [Actinocorallia sp. API 0066]MCD0453360.1 hypothetical protein [Actinocorallia sp. API 0066]
MALEFIGTDQESYEGQSPTVFVDPVKRELVLQSWDASPELIAEVERMFYPVPGHESVIRFPERMIPFLRQALDKLEALGGPDSEGSGSA